MLTDTQGKLPDYFFLIFHLAENIASHPFQRVNLSYAHCLPQIYTVCFKIL